MKTDLERFIELYKDFGIELKPYRIDDLISIRLAAPYTEKIIDNASHSAKFVGYHGFFASVNFDSNGKFISQGFWE